MRRQKFFIPSKSVYRLLDGFVRRRPFVSLGIALVASLVFLTALITVSNLWVKGSASGRVYETVDAVPSNDVGLVLGTIRYLPGGVPNLFFKYRIEAAVALYHAGKIRHILVSGDNHRHGYDEPTDMKAALVERGVPESAITCDYAGLRTLDSVVRAEKIFGLNQITIISQHFHNERALFIARAHGLEAVAYDARGVSFNYSRWTYVRESLARVKAVLDVYVLHKGPRLLGPREPIEIAQS